MHKQKAKRDAAKKAKYQAKLATIPEEPDDIDPKWDEPLKLTGILQRSFSKNS